MPIKNLDKEEIQNLINKFSKIQQIRQKSLEILIKIDKKTSDYKINMLKKKLEDLTK